MSETDPPLVDPEAAALLAPHLEPAERLLWAARPAYSLKRRLIARAPFISGVLLLGAIAAFFVDHDLRIWIVLAVLLFTVDAWGILVIQGITNLVRGVRLERCAYALTDRRVLVWSPRGSDEVRRGGVHKVLAKGRNIGSISVVEAKKWFFDPPSSVDFEEVRDPRRIKSLIENTLTLAGSNSKIS